MATNQTPSPDVWAFLRELVSRLGAKNPAFFNVMAWVGAIAAFITGIPLLLDSIPGLELPDSFEVIENKIVTIAGAVVFIMSNLTVQRPVAKHDSGETVTVVDGDRTNLPFTDKKEAKLPATEIHK